MLQQSPAMSMGHRIKAERERLGLSQGALGSLCGVSRQSVSNWERDAVECKGRSLIACAEAFGVNPHWLQTGNGPRLTGKKSELSVLGGTTVYVPVISWVQAGELADTGEIPQAEEYVPVLHRRESLVALRVRGTSMNRVAQEGDTIILDFEDKELVPGRLYVVRVPDLGMTFKRYKDNPPRLEPVSSEEFDPIFADSEWQVIGRVIQTIAHF